MPSNPPLTASGRRITVAPVGVAAMLAPPDLAALLSRMHITLSAKVWNEPSLRPSQEEAARRLADPPMSSNLLYIDKTGSRKTHVTRIVGIAEKGITLIITNLHSLSADQMAKFAGANQAYGTAEAHNVDEVFFQWKAKFNELLQRGRRLQRGTTSAVFLFTSPQFICHPPLTS